MTNPINNAERRKANQEKHRLARLALVQAKGGQGLAELWWDEARKIARESAARHDARRKAAILAGKPAEEIPAEADRDELWNFLALTLSNFCGSPKVTEDRNRP